MLAFLIAQVARGFCMGSADVVPGVSGGTIALVLGIYERLVSTIRQGASALGAFARLNISGGFLALSKVDWAFLVPLLAGVVAAILVLAPPLEHLLEDEPVPMAAAFFGLVIASIAIAWEGLRKRDAMRLLLLVASAVITFFVLGLRSGEDTDPELWFVFVAGAIAICAMILPGISGSFLLLMLGLYEFIIDSVNDRDLLVLAVFLAGCVIGLGLFSTALSAMLRRHPDTMLAALIGLMAGSLRVLWPWPGGVESTELAEPVAGDLPLALLLAVGAAIFVVGLTQVSRRFGNVSAGRGGSR